MFKILVSDKLGQAGLDILAAADDVEVDILLGKSKDELIAELPNYDGWIVRSGTRPDADMIKAASRLKVIGRAGIGVDNIDIAAATEQGVIVMNTPGSNSMATAEQTMALMLAVSRHTAHAHMTVANGGWNRGTYMGQELYRKTLGVIGFGRIGRLVTARAQAFGMTVVAYDPYVKEDDARALDVTLVDLDDLYAQSDYITLHTAATPETTNMINADALAQMKNSAIVINVARGKLINEADLAAALGAGQLKAAALDVYQSEPISADNPLVNHPKVTHTPHLGASSVEAQRNVAIMVVEQVLDAVRGTDVRNAVNLPFSSGPNFSAVRPYLDLAEKLGLLQYHVATAKIERVEIEVFGDNVAGLVRPIAASILTGLLTNCTEDEVNYVNAPVLADKIGLRASQARGLAEVEYPNFIACRIFWGDGEQHTLAGTVVGGKRPRVIKMSRFDVEGTPAGAVLLLRNKDVPGVVGQIGTLLAAYSVNIATWNMGRLDQGSEALCFINLDEMPPKPLLDAIAMIPAVTKCLAVDFDA
ncbi:MAG: phosphoglycerate dehydrogenase [Candidatus Promineifilaceae bacterium]